MVRETTLAPTDFIYPLFIVEGKDVRRPIASVPGIFNLSLEHAVAEARRAYALGVKAVLLFGIPDQKDARGSQAYAREGIVQRAVREVDRSAQRTAVSTANPHATGHSVV